MASGTLWNLAPVLVGAPLTAIACAFVVTLVRAWPLIMERVNEARRDRAGIRTGEMDRMESRIRRLEERCEALEAAVKQCEEREAEWRRRAITAEAILQGMGEVSQRTQQIVSADRAAREAEDKAKGRKR